MSLPCPHSANQPPTPRRPPLDRLPKGTPPSEISQWMRANAHKSWAATTDRTARTAPARAALEQKWLTLADGDPVRAASLRKAFFAELAAKSAQARRRNREAREGGTAA